MHKNFTTHTRRRTAALLAVLLIISTVFAAGADVPDLSDYSKSFVRSLGNWRSHEEEALALSHLGLFLGTGNGFELSREPTRIEALVTVIRLSGKEDEALSKYISHPFSDVPGWASAYAGYGYEAGISYGVGDGLFGSDETVTAKQYATMILRVLGYSDEAGDFSFEEAISFCEFIGLFSAREASYYLGSDRMLRDDAAFFMYRALRCVMPQGDVMLIEKLISDGAVDENLAYGSMLEKGESEEEIKRALSNGYSEFWYLDFLKLVENNKSIQESFKPVFINSYYNWLKEAGTEEGVAQIRYNISRLEAGTVNAAQDKNFSSESILAYFQYPNKIVLRSDLDPGMWEGTLAHEFRHAMTVYLGLTAFEEGLTDFWAQEVDGSYHAYPYYFINLAKFITHIAGAKTANIYDLTGGEEYIYYALESSTGVRLDKESFYLAVSSIDTSVTLENLNTLRSSLLTLFDGYYELNFDALISSASGAEEFADTIIALAQLIYFPSALIQDAESDLQASLPSAFYSDEAVTLMLSLLDRYCEKTGYSKADLLDYFQSAKNSRLCLKYFGSDAGSVYVRSGSSYKVFYRHNRQIRFVVFGSKADADAFSERVNVARIEEVKNSAFVKKEY